MSPAEVTWRARDQALRIAWSRRQVSRDELAVAARPPAVSRAAAERRFAQVLPPDVGARVPAVARAAVVEAADRLLRGEWEVLGVTRTDLKLPDWFADPVTGRRAPSDRYAFRINHRSQEQTGNIKQVWEISRLQHLTVLATAWFLTGDEAYALRVDEQLRSWWRENPFLSGVHWTSGIEIGIRLISLTWIRRLLADWPGAADLFERNELAVQQIRWHQQYLAAFRSRGSSANNHVIAEAAGQLVACCAFPWFAESGRWRQKSARLLESELARNTFPSGIGRELASDYQCFVAELGLLAAMEAEGSGRPVSAATWQRLCAMVDSGAALLDERMRPPRQGDGDEGRGLLLDAPAANRWPFLLALGEVLFGRLDWWPPTEADAASTIIGAMTAGPRMIPGRPVKRPSRFADAGITLLRTSEQHVPEIWCRCDGGPHGFLSIAAHAHADALSVEVRYGGVEILADPGTYCYHGEPEWRSYFRSTIAHNTVELGGQSQSGRRRSLPVAAARERAGDRSPGRRPGSRMDRGARRLPGARPAGPAPAPGPAGPRSARALDITDEIDGGGHDVRLAFHLGPDVQAELDGTSAVLSWPDAASPGGGAAGTAARADVEPAPRRDRTRSLGWYSGGLGHRVPAVDAPRSRTLLAGYAFPYTTGIPRRAEQL